MPINLKQGDNAVTEDKVDIAWGTSGALSPTIYTQHLYIDNIVESISVCVCCVCVCVCVCACACACACV